jgi:hypothetical protein
MSILHVHECSCWLSGNACANCPCSPWSMTSMHDYALMLHTHDISVLLHADIHVYGHAAWPSRKVTLHEHDAYRRWINIHTAWTRCMHTLHVHAACTAACSCMSMHIQSTYILRVHAAYPRCMNMLVVYAACQCCMSMLHEHATCPRCSNIVHERLHGHAALTCCMNTLNEHAVWKCYMNKQGLLDVSYMIFHSRKFGAHTRTILPMFIAAGFFNSSFSIESIHLDPSFIP